MGLGKEMFWSGRNSDLKAKRGSCSYYQDGIGIAYNLVVLIRCPFKGNIAVKGYLMNNQWFQFSLVLAVFAAAPLSWANLPSKSGPAIGEIKAEKAVAPEFEGGFDQLNRNERQFAESWEQQQKLRRATARISGGAYSGGKKAAQDLPSSRKKNQRR